MGKQGRYCPAFLLEALYHTIRQKPRPEEHCGGCGHYGDLFKRKGDQEKTGFGEIQIRNAIYRARQQGKIKNKERGIYISA